jgi:ABC-2 type transport system ATP-binding protein
MRLLGLPVPERRGEALQRVGAIVEEPSFHGHLTGRENLHIVAAAREQAAHARIPSVLETVGLSARADDRVKTYSMGMRQRLGVARVLLADPELLILDEPANGLDPAGILEFRGLIRRLVGEGRTVMLSSHLLDEVEKTCDAVAIVDRGRVVTQGTVAELRDGGGTQLLIEADPIDGARILLASNGAVSEVSDDGNSLRARLKDPAAAADLNRRLVEAGIAVRRLEPVQASLEQRFLEITSRFEEAA